MSHAMKKIQISVPKECYVLKRKMKNRNSSTVRR
jgi:hypothetical protein